MGEVGPGARVLMVATIAKNLVFQSPAMLDWLRARGVRLEFAAGEDSWAPALEELGTFHALPLDRTPSPARMARARSRLRDIVGSHSWDLVQVQSPIAAAALRAGGQAGEAAPSLYVAHGFHFHKDGAPLTNSAYAGIETALAGRTRALAVVCDEDFRAARSLGFHRRTILWRLPGAGVDLDRFSPGEADPGGGGGQVLFCGDLNQNKDPRLALEVVQRARALSGRDLRLHVVGDGPLAREVDVWVARAGWVSADRYLPAERIAELMRRSDALLAPSRREGLPRVVIEALACGLPVVARSNRGTRELLRTIGVEPLPGQASLDTWAKVLLDSMSAGRLAGRGWVAMQRYGQGAFLDSYAALLTLLNDRGTRAGAFDLEGQRVPQ